VARYTIEEYVRWEDIDAAGIINYQAYLRFFGLAEAELLRSAGLNYRFLFEVLGIWLPRVRVECNFYLPVKLDELLAVEAYFSRIGRTSVTSTSRSGASRTLRAWSQAADMSSSASRRRTSGRCRSPAKSGKRSFGSSKSRVPRAQPPRPVFRKFH
jgi:YbgC/YbaW family acyl-CoA thioester hydrolase